MYRTKEFRRDVEKKNKNKVKHIIKDVWHEEELLKNPKFVGKMANSRQLCSCEMCGNPRHDNFSSQKNKLTIQERKAEEDLKDWEKSRENEEN